MMTDKQIAENILTAQQDLERIENNIACGHGLTMEDVCDLAEFISTQLEGVRQDMEERGHMRRPVLPSLN
jgi:hypothetical protein